MTAPAAAETVAGAVPVLEPVAVMLAGVAVPEAVLDGTKLETATEGMVAFPYAAQVELGASGQSAAMQMDCS